MQLLVKLLFKVLSDTGEGARFDAWDWGGVPVVGTVCRGDSPSGLE